MPSYRSLAHNRDFTTLWAGQTISEIGSRMSIFVYPLVAYTLTGSALAAAWVEGAYLFAMVATLLPAGVLVDRVDPRTVMLCSSGAGAVLYTSLAVAGSLGHLTLAHLVVAALLSGAAAGLFGPAEISAVRSVVSSEDLPTALSQNQARQHVAALLGGPLGGALLAVTRWLPFAVDALTFAVSCFTLSRLRTDLAPTRADGALRRRAELVEGIQFVLVRPFFRTLATWSSLTNLLMNALLFVVVLRLIEGGVRPAHIGLVEMAAGAGGVLGALIAPALIERVATGHLTVGVAWAVALPLAPLVFWLTPVSAGVAMFVVMVLVPAGNAGMGAYRISVTPTHLQGRVASASQFLSMSVMPLAPLLGGLLLHHLGAPTSIAVLACASGAVALLPTLSRQIRSVPKLSTWQQRVTTSAAA